MSGLWLYTLAGSAVGAAFLFVGFLIVETIKQGTPEAKSYAAGVLYALSLAGILGFIKVLVWLSAFVKSYQQ